MRLTSVNRLVPGDCLARPVYDGEGRVLVGVGVPLTATMIRRLKELGVYALYLEDARTADVVLGDPLAPELRRRAVEVVREVMHRLTEGDEVTKRFVLQKQAASIRGVVNDLVEVVRENPEILQQVADIYTADGFLYHHSVHVAILSIGLGIEAGLTNGQLRDLGIGALLHDVGKLRIAPEILNKPTELTRDEYDLVKRHTTYGYEILQRLDAISIPSAQVALQHHERIDGSGYPLGLKGNEQHLLGRISAIADVYDAMTSHRVYRPGLLPHEAYEHIMAGCGTWYDSELVKIFVRQVAIYPVGQTVRLSTGEVGVVTEIPRGFPQRPRVRVLYDPEGCELAQPFERDLIRELSVVVADVFS
ncbi:HD-GYP domain-containing protein [Kyrpidia tusciae]|uniref:Metal dependent phosphohydrolase n=1 Tax=Kyrpidia tusciae (strain DSM 2912 / NBRC 15312 / T2) TaxID=562970 RepID=D5WRL5_KYRT2|nr:HD-GYP domain-containing protein [Kyrpidia tusciae]ADG04876.1 metal dependent phosphohydrolase [Kyrpidia tusciae DSM 2912]